MSQSRKLIVVLGAHRSGTSLCAAAIEALGADACLGEYYANDENQKGFFEHPDIVDFNDQLLAELGGSWDNPLFDGSQALAHTDSDQWIEQATELILGIFGDCPVAVVKDPRMCQLLPFWVTVFERAGYSPGSVYYVHTLRDPVEVAMSQRQRARANPDYYEFGRSLREGAALWLSLSAQQLESSEGLNNVFLSYKELMTKPRETLERLASFTGLSADPQRTGAFVDNFVDPDLYRSIADDESLAELRSDFPEVLDFNEQLERLLEGDAPGEVLIACRGISERESTRRHMFEAASAALSRLSTSCRDDRLRLKTEQEVVVDLEQQIEELRLNTDRMRQEHTEVVEPLRRELSSLEEGNSQLQSQVSSQSEELERITGIAERNQAAVVQLSDQKAQLEHDVVQLSSEIETLSEQRQTLSEERDVLADTVGQMEASTSWRITRPLRSVTTWLRQSRHSMAGQWVQFRLKAILVYHRMSLRYPGLAWVIRRILRPVFRLLNRAFSVTPRDMHPGHDANLLTPLRYQLQEANPDYAPLVSIIVPNYNHEQYLELRLESIFSQSYQNFEVILLDDASTDGSAEVLRKFHARYPEKSKLIINEQNSGGVFHQWERGLDNASGDLVWIAESDDWCTENFLSTLVPYFENEAIMLAYSRTVFMDGAGERQIWSINEYLHDIDPHRWNHEIIETGPAIVRQAFAVKNIVPNVSSAVFRLPRQLEILKDTKWREMQTCGDWVLYLHLLRGGMLAYSPLACNYYRIHQTNTSVSSYSEDNFYREHETVAKTVKTFFEVPQERFAELRNNLEIHWRETRGDYSDAALESCFSLERIDACGLERAPNLLMASYAFCSGGGETFPISLANIMKKHGYNVTYLDCDREPRIAGVRDKLRRDIPIVSDFSQLERIVADFEIDIVHSHHAWMDSTVLDVLPEDSPCQTVVTLHGMYETINEYDLRAILPRLVKRSACLIYVAEKNLDAIKSEGLLQYARTMRIDNALDREEFPLVERDSLGIAGEAFVLTVVSRAMVEKGWQEAIEAVAMARERSGNDIHLVLVGDGTEYDRLGQENVAEYVHLVGFQKNVRGYFGMADLGFLPSKFRGESSPLVLIECLQSGVPFLASDLGEIESMLDTTIGLAGAVLPLEGDELDVNGLADLIAELSGRGDRYISMRGQVEEAANKFDPDLMASKHDEVYRSVSAAGALG